MAEALYLVRRTVQGVNNDRNRVREVLTNRDDGLTDAQRIQAVIDDLNTAQPVETGAEPIYPDGYFDTVQLVAVASGPLSTDGDFVAFAPRIVSVTT
jgi:hypothetical protein